MRAFVKKFGQRVFFGAAHCDWLAIDNARDFRGCVVHVSNQNCFGRAHHNAGRLETYVDAMRTEITFLGGVVFGIDEDRVVRTSCHAGFAANADRFIEVYDSVWAFEHRRRGTCRHTRCMSALITASYLVRATGLRKLANVNVLDICTSHRQRHDVLRLAGSRTRVTTNATRMVDHLGPFDWGGWLHHVFFALMTISRTANGKGLMDHEFSLTTRGGRILMVVKFEFMPRACPVFTNVGG